MCTKNYSKMLTHRSPLLLLLLLLLLPLPPSLDRDATPWRMLPRLLRWNQNAMHGWLPRGWAGAERSPGSRLLQPAACSTFCRYFCAFRHFIGCLAIFSPLSCCRGLSDLSTSLGWSWRWQCTARFLALRLHSPSFSASDFFFVSRACLNLLSFLFPQIVAAIAWSQASRRLLMVGLYQPVLSIVICSTGTFVARC